MRVLYEEEVRALLAAAPAERAGDGVACFLDLAASLGAGWPRAGAAAVAAPLARGLLEHAAARRAGRLELAVFGGEARPGLELAAELSAALQRACLAAAVGYEAHLVADGAPLDAAWARRLSGAGVVRVQLGLELPRRGAPGGAWARVLDAAAGARGAAGLVLRAAVEPGGDLERLVDALEARGLAGAGSGVALYLARRAPSLQQARELVAISDLLRSAAAPSLRQ